MSEKVPELNKVIKLPIDSLRSFEVIGQQFADLGVIFSNTVVLHPSNSAYLPKTGKMVLMGAPQNGWMEIDFTVPIGYFACYLTSSQHVTLYAYDGEGEVLSFFETEKQDYQDCEHSEILMGGPPPNTFLEIQALNIQKITLNSLDGQLVIHNVKFGF